MMVERYRRRDVGKEGREVTGFASNEIRNRELTVLFPYSSLLATEVVESDDEEEEKPAPKRKATSNGKSAPKAKKAKVILFSFLSPFDHLLELTCAPHIPHPPLSLCFMGPD